MRKREREFLEGQMEVRERGERERERAPNRCYVLSGYSSHPSYGLIMTGSQPFDHEAWSVNLDGGNQPRPLQPMMEAKDGHCQVGDTLEI